MAAEHDEPLIRAALQMRDRAHAPYSNFRVGAAVVGASGTIYTGCNVENASYGLTCCAERVAMFAGVAAGESHFTTIAVASVGGAAPCGACRQVLAEFADELRVVLVDADNPSRIHELRLSALLPHRFGPSSPGLRSNPNSEVEHE